MGHFAQINEVNHVVQVVVADDDKQQWLETNLGGTWLQTSYNTVKGVHINRETGLPSADQSKALRGNFAGIGMIYDPQSDLFLTAKPFDSWILDAPSASWTAPVPMPNDGQTYEWDESALDWVAVAS
jgi:hypothetical protein